MSKETIPINGVSGFEKPPFTPKYLEEEKEDTGNEIISLRINPEERAILNHLKAILHYSQDAKVLKIGLSVLKNVIHSSLSDEIMFRLTEERRRRPVSDEKHIIKKIDNL